MIKKINLHTLLVIFFASILILLFASGVFAKTDVSDDLPPRPQPTATPIPTQQSSPPDGAFIQLQASKSLPGAWTQVQWQNEHGDWYDVNGWRGHLDDGAANMKTWWIASENLGDGPFRWVVFTEEDGTQLAVSESFDLPENIMQVQVITINIP